MTFTRDCVYRQNYQKITSVVDKIISDDKPRLLCIYSDYGRAIIWINEGSFLPNTKGTNFNDMKPFEHCVQYFNLEGDLDWNHCW